MPQNDVDVCNIAQKLLGAEELGSIAPPRTVNEKRYAAIYETYRDAELRKRRWNFAKQFFQLTPTGDPIVTDNATLYRFQWPNNAVRVIRESGSIWIPSGRQLLADAQTLKVWFICSTSAAEMDPLFAVMFACKLAETLCEAITQSNEKKKTAAEQYEMARREAGAANAFEIGPEDIAADDSKFSWVQSRNNA